MRRSGFGVGVSKSKMTKAMVEILSQLPNGTTNLKDVVVAHLGLLGQMSPSRDINAAWNEAKKKVANQFPEKFVLGARGVLQWNDDSVKILDKKISSANFHKLNEIAEAENCTVDKLVSKLILKYRRENP
ncbi:MAG: hypothetical protein R6X27_15285 [Candidatus Desulfacyla sp.]